MFLKDRVLSIFRHEVPLWQVISYIGGAGLLWYLLSKPKKSQEILESKSNKAKDKLVSVTDSEGEEEIFGGDPYGIKNSYSMLDGPFKLVLCVNMRLKMGSGKIAAQCGHATLGAFKIAQRHCKSAVDNWEYYGQAKIAVKVDKEETMFEIYEKARNAGLVTYLVEDAGRTQIAAGSKTVLGILKKININHYIYYP